MAAAVLLAVGLVSFPVGQARALTEENLVFLEAWRVVDRAYVDKSFNGQSWFRYREQALKKEPMNNREQTYAAIRKMLASLDDPFTRFFEPGKFRSLKAGTQGQLTGVGLELGFSLDGKQLVVVAPVPGGAADRAGVAPRDVILRVNGEAVNGLGLYDAAQKLQGPADSQVELTVQRGGEAVKQLPQQQSQQSQPSQPPQELTFTLTRQKVSLNPVIFRTCDLSRQASAALLTSGNGSAGSFGSNGSAVTRVAEGGGAGVGVAPAGSEEKVRVGYIRLTTFNQNSSSALKQALEQLTGEGATAFILDIRNNSGGLFPSAIEIAKMWINKGVLVYITDSLGVRDVYETNGEGSIATTQPLAVLVNKGTASASEILAGALKDNNRALVFGEPTFGKGKIQSVFELSDGSGLAVTIARYETPDHTDIDKFLPVDLDPTHLAATATASPLLLPPSLTHIELARSSTISALPHSLSLLTSLQTLSIRRFSSLLSLPFPAFNHHPPTTNVLIASCPSLALPSSCPSRQLSPCQVSGQIEACQLAKLQELRIAFCKKLTCLPDSLHLLLPSLSRLVLFSSTALSTLPEYLDAFVYALNRNGMNFGD
ncbi:unnamed protein product [Closterium sp. Naga37s-1]|nr:unnamed protein product [Closterium sp. Naga37s-1]